MNDSSRRLLKTLEALGPEVFAVNGSLSLWTSIIDTVAADDVRQLLDVIHAEADTCAKKYSLATRILTDGFADTVDEYRRRRQPLPPPPPLPIAPTPPPSESPPITPVPSEGQDIDSPDRDQVLDSPETSRLVVAVEDIIEDIAEDIVEEVAENSVENTVKDIIGEIFEDIPEDNVEAIVDDIVDTVEDMVEDICDTNAASGGEELSESIVGDLDTSHTPVVDHSLIDMDEELIPEPNQLMDPLDNDFASDSEDIFMEVSSQPAMSSPMDLFFSPESYKSCYSSPQKPQTVTTSDPMIGSNETIDQLDSRETSEQVTSDETINLLASDETSDRHLKPLEIDLSGQSSSGYQTDDKLVVLTDSVGYSTPTRRTIAKDWAARGLSGSGLGSPLSPISLSPRRAVTISPTLSLNTSYTSTSSLSPKSSSSRCSLTTGGSGSVRSKRSSPPKSPEELIQMYKSLVPYEAYCSEQHYLKHMVTTAATTVADGQPSGDDNPMPIASHAIPRQFLDQIIQQNLQFMDKITD